MDDRIKVSAELSYNCLVFHTYSRKLKRSGYFYVQKDCFQGLEERGSFMCRDGISIMVANRNNGRDTLTITFVWLNREGDGSLTGREETVTVSGSSLLRFIRQGEEENGTRIWNVLSVPESRGPRMVFQSRKNLKAVVRNKVICHKFTKALTSHFHWRGSDEIVIYDDSLPYSFYFEERINGKTGICGGIIFHNEDNDLVKANYGVHT